MSGTRVCLVLGGGGSRAMVHVGVIAELVHQRFEIASIVGTSMGAIIGALFAYNRAVRYGHLDVDTSQSESAKAIEDLFFQTDFRRMSDINWRSPFRRGLLNGVELEDWLKTQLWHPQKREDVCFLTLGFDLTITATDALNGDSLVINQGSAPGLAVYRAARASASVQGLFREIDIEINGQRKKCWDGGTTGNCRFDVGWNLKPDILTIASTVTYRGEPVTIRTVPFLPFLRQFAIATQSVRILMRQMEELLEGYLRATDSSRLVIVRPDVGSCGGFDVDLEPEQKRDLFRNGRLATQQVLQARGLVPLGRD